MKLKADLDILFQKERTKVYEKVYGVIQKI